MRKNLFPALEAPFAFLTTNEPRTADIDGALPNDLNAGANAARTSPVMYSVENNDCFSDPARWFFMWHKSTNRLPCTRGFLPFCPS